jgi:hypothetical protein
METKVPDLSAKLGAIVESIDSPSLRGVVSHVFTCLIDLLENVDLLEVCISADAALPKMHHMFKFINQNGQTLVSYIDTKAKLASGIPKDLCDLLDGTSFALQHELQRVIIISDSYANESDEQLRSKCLRAYGLLRNCFQQCVVSLAKGFRPSIKGAELFADFTLLREQSVVLVEALTILIQQSDRAESLRNLDSYFAISEGLKMFKEGYMHYLIYRDWAEFDTFSDKILEARTEFNLWPLLGQFTRYLETLMGHVQMREVLRNHSLQPALVEQLISRAK